METVADVISTAAGERYHTMIRDLKHSLRRLAAHPGIIAAAVASLALGVGANTAIFSVVYGSLLKPLPYPAADRRVIIATTSLINPSLNNSGGVAPLDFVDWRAQSKTLEDFHLFTYRGVTTAIG